jgi:hypothetical protein
VTHLRKTDRGHKANVSRTYYCDLNRLAHSNIQILIRMQAESIQPVYCHRLASMPRYAELVMVLLTENIGHSGQV